MSSLIPAPVMARAADLGLIDPQALYSNPSDWVILDARPRAEWAKGRIPGSIPFSWEDYTRKDENGVPYRIWPAGELAAALGEMGIDEKTPIAVYGDADTSWGGEGWAVWALAWLGHKGPVRLLAGGVQAWKEGGFMVASGKEMSNRKPARYKFTARPEVDMTTADLKLSRSSLTVIDTRSTLERLKGRIPGSVHIEWTGFFSGKNHTPLSAEALGRLLRKNGVDLKRPVVYYCTGGIRSAYAWLVHELAGLPHARNYEGGMEAWERARE